jgi:hypothetical protein
MATVWPREVKPLKRVSACVRITVSQVTPRQAAREAQPSPAPSPISAFHEGLMAVSRNFSLACTRTRDQPNQSPSWLAVRSVTCTEHMNFTGIVTFLATFVVVW